MDNDLSFLAKNLSEKLGGDGRKKALESIVRLLSTDSGKKVMASLLSDGGDALKRVAESAKNGDAGAVAGVISMIASTPEGLELLKTLRDDLEKSSGR